MSIGPRRRRWTLADLDCSRGYVRPCRCPARTSGGKHAFAVTAARAGSLPQPNRRPVPLPRPLVGQERACTARLNGARAPLPRRSIGRLRAIGYARSGASTGSRDASGSAAGLGKTRRGGAWLSAGAPSASLLCAGSCEGRGRVGGSARRAAERQVGDAVRRVRTSDRPEKRDAEELGFRRGAPSVSLPRGSCEGAGSSLPIHAAAARASEGRRRAPGPDQPPGRKNATRRSLAFGGGRRPLHSPAPAPAKELVRVGRPARPATDLLAPSRRRSRVPAGRRPEPPLPPRASGSRLATRPTSRTDATCHLADGRRLLPRRPAEA
jgi:hypothetical protein